MSKVEEQVRGVLGKRTGNSLEFAGKVALITGGNSGIGAAAALSSHPEVMFRTLCRKGATVIASADSIVALI
jgi:NAD(P)-dependent dehydrogenase (short-subunit alcohol dehydrogenase family)